MKNRISIPDTDLAFHPLGLGTVNAGLTWDGADAEQIIEAMKTWDIPFKKKIIWRNKGILRKSPCNSIFTVVI